MDITKITAFHEAGHAVVKYKNCHEGSDISIVPNDDSSGQFRTPDHRDAEFMQIDIEDLRKKRGKAYLAMLAEQNHRYYCAVEHCLAGYLADKRFIEIKSGKKYPEYFDVFIEEYCSDDCDEAEQYLMMLIGEVYDIDDCIWEIRDHVKNYFKNSELWGATSKLAKTLLDKKEINCVECEEILKQFKIPINKYPYRIPEFEDYIMKKYFFNGHNLRHDLVRSLWEKSQ